VITICAVVAVVVLPVPIYASMIDGTVYLPLHGYLFNGHFVKSGAIAFSAMAASVIVVGVPWFLPSVVCLAAYAMSNRE